MASFADKLLAVGRACCFVEHLLETWKMALLSARVFCLVISPEIWVFFDNKFYVWSIGSIIVTSLRVTKCHRHT